MTKDEKKGNEKSSSRGVHSSYSPLLLSASFLRPHQQTARRSPSRFRHQQLFRRGHDARPCSGPSCVPRSRLRMVRSLQQFPLDMTFTTATFIVLCFALLPDVFHFWPSATGQTSNDVPKMAFDKDIKPHGGWRCGGHCRPYCKEFGLHRAAAKGNAALMKAKREAYACCQYTQSAMTALTKQSKKLSVAVVRKVKTPSPECLIPPFKNMYDAKPSKLWWWVTLQKPHRFNNRGAS